TVPLRIARFPSQVETLPMVRRCLSLLAVCALASLCGTAPAHAQPPKPRVDALGDALPEGAVARLGTTRFRPSGKKLLGISHAGKSLLFHGPGAIPVMDLETGKFSKVLRYQEEAKAAPMKGLGLLQMQGAALSGDGRVLAHVDTAEQAFGIVD